MSCAIPLAGRMYEARDSSAMPVLADALQDADCGDAEVLDHCRGPGPHVRGCRVADLVLGKESHSSPSLRRLWLHKLFAVACWACVCQIGVAVDELERSAAKSSEEIE